MIDPPALTPPAATVTTAERLARLETQGAETYRMVREFGDQLADHIERTSRNQMTWIAQQRELIDLLKVPK